MVVDDMQVYITGVLYQDNAYPSNVKELFNLLDSKFREVNRLEYFELLINRSECRFSNTSTREQLLIFMKDVVYNGVVFLTDLQSSSLRAELINKLDSISDIQYSDVEIRVTRTK